MINIAIFASGSGSNAENIVNYFKDSEIAKIKLIVSNKKDAYVLERAKKLDIRSAVFSKYTFECSNEILNLLISQSIDFIILAGFLLKVPDNLLKEFPHKIINIHPALLPKFGGKGMYGDNVHKAVVDARESESGITIHSINENYDEGDILFQKNCIVLTTDTFEDVAQKVHALEYEYFPKVIESLILNKI